MITLDRLSEFSIQQLLKMFSRYSVNSNFTLNYGNHLKQCHIEYNVYICTIRFMRILYPDGLSNLLYCIAFYYLALYCVILHCIALYCTVLRYIALYCVIFHCILLYCVALCYIALHYVILHCIVLYCIALCYIALHCVRRII